MKTRTEKRTAQDAYIDAHLTAQTTVEEIQKLLFDLPAPDSDETINWCHVAELNEINSRLSRVVAFLTNTDD